MNLSRTSDLAHRLAAEAPHRRDLAPLVAFDTAIHSGPASRIPPLKRLARETFGEFEAARSDAL